MRESAEKTIAAGTLTKTLCLEMIEQPDKWPQANLNSVRTKPSPEQFGLRADSIASIAKAQEDVERRRTVFSMYGGGVVWTVAAILLIISWSSDIHDAGHLLMLVPIIIGSFFFGGIAGMAGMAVSTIIAFFVYHDVPEHARLTKYQEAVKGYDAWYIRTQCDFWDKLTGREFEIEVANLLNRAGYHASLTPASGDEGVDIVLGDGTIVQCKAHRAPASPGVVRELYGALIHQKAPKALLISRSGWTKGVHSFIQGKPIMVWDTANLIALQKGLDELRGTP